MCSANTRGQGYVGLFYETIHSKGPTTHWWTQRHLGSRDTVYGSTDILGLFVRDTVCIIRNSVTFKFIVARYIIISTNALLLLQNYIVSKLKD